MTMADTCTRCATASAGQRRMARIISFFISLKKGRAAIDPAPSQIPPQKTPYIIPTHSTSKVAVLLVVAMLVILIFDTAQSYQKKNVWS